MQKISESTNTANPAGEFTEGNPAAGAPATLLKAAWLNAIQRELVGLVLGAGISLNANDDGQVLKAVKALAGAAADFNKLANKPTTLTGYGITDAFTKPETTNAIQQAISNLVASSPAALDTLKELAVALGNDPNFATTMTNALAGKADKSQLGTAAALAATTSPTDTTVGRALRVGDFGLGGGNSPPIPSGDCNSIVATGFYPIVSGTVNKPGVASTGSMLLHMNYSAAAGGMSATQEVITRSSPARKFWRACVVGVWGDWVEAAVAGVNSSITALTGLTERPSFGGNLAWDAGNFNPSIKVSGDRSNAAGFVNGDKSLPYIRHTDNTIVYLQVDRPKDTALLSANGWSKNADTGEIIQWCEYAIGDAQGATSSIAVTWPFQFPTQCLNIRMSFRVASGSPSRMVASSYPLTLSGTTVLLEEATTAVQAGLVLMIEVRGN